MRDLTPVEEMSLKQIKIDAHFIYSLTTHADKFSPSAFNMFLPYLAIFANEASQWSKKVGIDTPELSVNEKEYYKEMRSGVKFLEMTYQELYHLLHETLCMHDKYFFENTGFIPKMFSYYFNVGVDFLENDKFCGNTILHSMYIPDFRFGRLPEVDGVNPSIIAGKICSVFLENHHTPYTYNNVQYLNKDYHFFRKCPIKVKTFDGFCLFSILCTINYVIHFLDKIFPEESSTKLRFAYLQYYYLVELIEKINKELSILLEIDTAWKNQKFRNCMAHYGLGVELKENDLLLDEPLGGLTNKIFNKNYYETKQGVFQNLQSIALQIEQYLF